MLSAATPDLQLYQEIPKVSSEAWVLVVAGEYR